MTNRRQFIKKTAKFFLAALMLINPLFSRCRRLFSQTMRNILPADISMAELIRMYPKDLDASNIKITPLEDFGTMGTTDHVVDVSAWWLGIHGKVARPLKLSLKEIRKLPSVQKKILMICPGFFANQGLWKGVDMKELLNRVRPAKDAEKIVFHGANKGSVKIEIFPLAEIISGEIFLAYEVNGVPLPRKHGFPLRVVARDYYGGDWVKYVYEIEVM
jgi:DMSO/TMAO reductase YedYZ molybdopterin-dependent catalytic subunit